MKKFRIAILLALFASYTVSYAEPAVTEVLIAENSSTEAGVKELPKMDVYGHSDLVTPDIEEARAKLERVPGGDFVDYRRGV